MGKFKELQANLARNQAVSSCKIIPKYKKVDKKLYFGIILL